MVALIAFVVGVLPAPAEAAGDINSLRQTFYTSFVHYRVNFQVYDALGYCVKDEDGFYNDPDCMDYDEQRAEIDIAVYRMRGARRPRIVYSDRVSGSRGRATERVYMFELNTPSCPHPSIRYRAVFRLRDPISDRVVSTDWARFHAFCPR